MRETAKKLSPVGARIDNIRRNKGVLMGTLATRARIDPSQRYRIMYGGSRPSRDSLLRICRALGCDVEEAAYIFDATEFRAPSVEDLGVVMA